MQPPEPTPAEIAKLEKVAEDSTRWIDGVLDHYKVGTRDPESVPTYLRDTAFKLADANYYLSMAVRWLKFIAVALVVIAGLLALVALRLLF